MESFVGKAEPYQDLWQLAKQYSIIDTDNTNMNYSKKTFAPDVNKTWMTNKDIDKFCSWSNPSSVGITKSHLNLSNHLRMLWEQHIIWTVFTIVSLIEDRPYKDLVVSRLLRNPVDFEIALRPLYGNEKAAKFSNLLTTHLVIASDLVKAAKAGDNKAVADAEKKWYANADEIAAFLGSINPYWSRESWRQMLYKHLELTKSEAVYWLTKEYQKAINIYDEIEKQALDMADMMTEGIVNQFPNMFIK